MPASVSFDPKTLLAASNWPARDITIQAGRRDFLKAQFAKYGLNFDLLPNYPDKLVNPRSQVVSIGAEREIAKGLFVGTDYVHQHWTDHARTVDLNAPVALRSHGHRPQIIEPWPRPMPLVRSCRSTAACARSMC